MNDRSRASLSKIVIVHYIFLLQKAPPGLGPIKKILRSEKFSEKVKEFIVLIYHR
jgi:hypothetical protein